MLLEKAPHCDMKIIVKNQRYESTRFITSPWVQVQWKINILQHFLILDKLDFMHKYITLSINSEYYKTVFSLIKSEPKYECSLLQSAAQAVATSTRTLWFICSNLLNIKLIIERATCFFHKCFRNRRQKYVQMVISKLILLHQYCK